MKRKTGFQKIMITIILFFLCILAIYVWNNDSSVSQVVVTITAVIGTFAIFYEMKRTKDLAEGEFILNLDKEFSSNNNYSELFMKCWSNEEITYEDNREELLEYLTFFETIYIMLQKNVLDINMLDELFSRRFFAVVNNRQVQKEDLIKNYKYYINIYKLHALWKEYTIKNNKDLYCNSERWQKDLQKSIKDKLDEENKNEKNNKVLKDEIDGIYKKVSQLEKKKGLDKENNAKPKKSVLYSQQ